METNKFRSFLTQILEILLPDFSWGSVTFAEGNFSVITKHKYLNTEVTT